ncbi:MAG: hypothetical protein GKS03_15605 [Alphaproteobacteria bacterium]|nr:hypothetical protein [Alphaproteobacteria bacterium]
MAIDEIYLSLVKSVLAQRDPAIVESTMTRAACLSYPDLLVSEKSLASLFGEEIGPNLRVRSDHEQVKKYHGLPADFGPIYETESLFEHLRVQSDFIDVKKLRGPEKIVDLNELLPAEYHQTYDLVIDTGTLEHCFNIGNAFRSMCEMTKLGGYIITMAPMTSVNHGFWNLCPTAYLDGFDQNGFALQYLQARYKDASGVKFIDFSKGPANRVIAPPEATLMCVARRTSVEQFKWPIQSKYKAMLSAGG